MAGQPAVEETLLHLPPSLEPPSLRATPAPGSRLPAAGREQVLGSGGTGGGGGADSPARPVESQPEHHPCPADRGSEAGRCSLPLAGPGQIRPGNTLGEDRHSIFKEKCHFSPVQLQGSARRRVWQRQRIQLRLERGGVGEQSPDSSKRRGACGESECDPRTLQLPPPVRALADRFPCERWSSHFEGRLYFLQCGRFEFMFQSHRKKTKGKKKRGRKKCTTLDGAVQHLFKPSEYSRLLGRQSGEEPSPGRGGLGWAEMGWDTLG